MEHVNDLKLVCKEFHRILKPGGVFYSTFGPLYYTWHGDHYSGWDGLSKGYNHLLLNKSEYEKYLNKQRYFGHSEEDGRTWIRNNLFSYLKPFDYINIFNKCGFSNIYTSVILEPEAIKCFNMRSDIKEKLLKQHSITDLLITGMTIIFKKVKK